MTLRATSDLLVTMLRDRPARRTFLVILTVIGGLAATHVASGHAARIDGPTGAFARWLHFNVDLTRDHSLSEAFGYTLAATAAMLFLTSYLASGRAMFLALAALMTFVWLDDSMRYHERSGEFLAEALSLPEVLGLRAQDLGELIAWSFAGLILAVLFIGAMRRANEADFALLTLAAAAFLVLAGAGVGADMIAIVAPDIPGMAVIEDGGELVGLSIFAFYAIALSRLVHSEEHVRDRAREARAPQREDHVPYLLAGPRA